MTRSRRDGVGRSSRSRRREVGDVAVEGCKKATGGVEYAKSAKKGIAGWVAIVLG